MCMIPLDLVEESRRGEGFCSEQRRVLCMSSRVYNRRRRWSMQYHEWRNAILWS